MNTSTTNQRASSGFTVRMLLAACALLFVAPNALRADEPPAIERLAVESSVLVSVGYDAKAQVLDLEFRSGAIYRYLEVPAEIHRQLLAAESKGSFFGKNIRNKFRSEQVKPRAAK